MTNKLSRIIKPIRERETLENVSGVIRLMSNEGKYIPYTFDKLSCKIQSARPHNVDCSEMRTLAKIIHQHHNGWMNVRNYRYEVKNHDKI